MTNLEKVLIKSIVSQAKALDELQDKLCHTLGLSVTENAAIYTIINDLTIDLRKHSWAQFVEVYIDSNDFLHAVYNGDADTIIDILEKMEEENGGILPC